MAAPAFKNDLSAREPRDLEQYRSVSGLAVCSLLLGLVSIASLAHPAAWILPLISILCGALALLRIARQPDTLMGGRLALLGFALGLFFGLWAISSYTTERWIVCRQALEFSDQWLDAVAAGNLEAAHQATLDYYLREPEGTKLVDNYQQDPEQLKQLQDFFSEGIAKQLVDLGEDATRQHDRTLMTATDSTSRYVNSRYFIRPRDATKPVLHVQLEMLMELRDDGVFWTMLIAEDAEFLDRPRRY